MKLNTSKQSRLHRGSSLHSSLYMAAVTWHHHPAYVRPASSTGLCVGAHWHDQTAFSTCLIRHKYVRAWLMFWLMVFVGPLISESASIVTMLGNVQLLARTRHQSASVMAMMTYEYLSVEARYCSGEWWCNIITYCIFMLIRSFTRWLHECTATQSCIFLKKWLKLNCRGTGHSHVALHTYEHCIDVRSPHTSTALMYDHHIA